MSSEIQALLDRYGVSKGRQKAILAVFVEPHCFRFVFTNGRGGLAENNVPEELETTKDIAQLTDDFPVDLFQNTQKFLRQGGRGRGDKIHWADLSDMFKKRVVRNEVRAVRDRI